MALAFIVRSAVPRLPFARDARPRPQRTVHAMPGNAVPMDYSKLPTRHNQQFAAHRAPQARSLVYDVALNDLAGYD